MKKILNYLFEHKTLTRSEAGEILTNMAAGIYSESEMAAFITVYLMRSITVEELAGFRDALLNLCLKTDLSDFETMDVCGTGGDNKDTFNISTICTFILAGAGLKMVKHGNYAVSSICGSSNIMEFYGYKFSNDRARLAKEIDKTGVCFLHAPLFNPAMKNIAPVRRSLKIKTFFNMLGPLINPAFPFRQMIGVYSLDLARLYNYLFQQTEKGFAIVYSLDGYDEVSLTSDFKYVLNGAESFYSPSDIGFQKVNSSELKGGLTVGDSARMFIDILGGQGSRAQTDVVLANAQMALKCRYPEKSLNECKEIADESVASGRALDSFRRLISMQ